MRPILSRVLFALAFLIPGIALAQAAAASLPTDVPGVIQWFHDTHANGSWSLIIGGVITLILRFAPVVKPLLDKLPAETTKWVAAGLAMLGSIATGLMTGIPWYKVLFDGLQVAMAAVGGWELILKPMLTKLGLQKVTPTPAG